MYAIFVFETKTFIEETRHLFSDHVGRRESWLPPERMFEWYDWVFGFILTQELALPVITSGFRNATMENVYRAEEPAIRQAFNHVISPEELLKIPTYGQLKYVFNGNQLFLFSCSPV